MKLFKKLFDFYIESSIHVGLSVYAFVRISELYLGLNYNENLDLFILFGTIFGYNYTKYNIFLKFNSKLPKNIKLIFGFSLFCLFATIYFSFKLSLTSLLISIPFSLLVLFYSIPLKTQKSLRNIPSLKIIIIAVAWAGTTVVLPFFSAEKIINSNLILLTLQRFIFVITLTLPFDIRDFEQDKTTLKTFPQLIGIQKTKKLGFILLLISMFLEFFISPTQKTKIIFAIILIFLLILLQRASTKQSKYYSSFWVESIPFFWWLILV